MKEESEKKMRRKRGRGRGERISVIKGTQKFLKKSGKKYSEKAFIIYILRNTHQKAMS